MKKIFISIVILIASTLCYAQQGNVPDAVELAALTDFYNSTNGASWSINTNWLQGTTAADFATWEGITVENGDVVEIYLQTRNLTGTLPASLGDLSELKKINILNNSITGTFPDWSGMTKMESLNIGKNNYSPQPFPSWVTGMTNLYQLNLERSSLTGSIPTSIGNLTNLQVLKLFINSLSGSIPSEIGNLVNLTHLHLYNNTLSGSLPSSLNNLINLKELHISNCDFTGLIPDLSSLTQLERFIFAKNEFTPQPIPNWLGNLQNLSVINMEWSNLTGTIPSNIWGLSQLTTLNLFKNSLTGSLPSNIGNLTSLTFLKLSANSLSGSIPAEIGNILTLTNLQLDRNDFTGPIPAEIGNLSNLVYLYLYACDLSGEIPSSIGNLTLLKDLRLNQNQLTGEVPSTINNLTKLESLYLHYNNLSGLMPSMHTLTKMKYFYAGYNDFTGPIPVGMLQWTNGRQLRFESNRFTSMPDLSGFTGGILQHILVQQNLLDFSSLEPNLSTGSNVATYMAAYYYGQGSEESLQTVYFDQGIPKVIAIPPDGTSTQYKWQRWIDGIWTDLSASSSYTGENSASLTLASPTESTAGRYRCKLTNTVVTGETLYSDNFELILDLTSQVNNSPVAENPPASVSVPDIPPTNHLTPVLNYVRSFTAQRATTNSADFNMTALPEDILVSTQYMDGLGRAVQSVTKEGSVDKKDIIQPVTYDEYGRQDKSYLPYVGGNATGSYVPNMMREQYDFYDPDNLTPPYTEMAKTQYAFSETTFESSPMNRVIAVNAPGETWEKGTDRGVKTEYKTNLSTDGVRQWTLSSGLQSSGTYPEHSLYSTVTIDEMQRKVIEFTNKKQQVVLKKVQSEQNDWLETYYVYDDFGNLRYVIPPEGTEALENNSWIVTPGIIEDWMFVYQYDNKQRMIEKKVPGADPVYMVYDARDRLRLTQDGVQRLSNQFTFTKYDVWNRPVMTGIVTLGTITAVRTAVENLEDYESEGAAMHGYTNTTYPTDAVAEDYMTVTYYDDYVFEFGADPNLMYYSELGNPANFTAVKGQVTGSKVKNLEDNSWIRTITYYDDRYRVLQTMSDHHLDGVVRQTNRYDFKGMIRQSLATTLLGTTLNKVRRSFHYDHGGRLLKVYHRFNTMDSVLLVENEYNALGELITKNIHSTDQGANFLQNVDYTYNIRGWLTGINDSDLNDPNDLFGMELYYDYGFEHAQFNGNISGVKWKTLGDEHTQAYGYLYDEVNRLKGGDYAEGTAGVWTFNKDDYNVESITYDKNGNILTLNRFGEYQGSSVAIDELDYDYSGNQLTRVDDNKSDQEGFKEKIQAAGEYIYDENGNMTRDDNKGITNIEYNYLNLPRKVTKDDGQYIKYLYDAAGIKLSQEVYDASDNLVKKTDYLGEFIYENDTLQFFQHEEGRVAVDRSWDYANGVEEVDYKYQYNMTDHLGNVRMTIQEPETEIYVATMEDVPGAVRIEEFYEFANIYQTEDDAFPTLNHTAATAENPNPKWTAKLDGFVSVIGPAKMIPVIPGDQVQAETFVRYLDESSYGDDVSEAVLANLLGSTFAQLSPGESAVNLANYFSEAFTIKGGYGSQTTDRPRAFLNYIFFDKDHKYKDMGTVQMGTAGAFTDPTIGVHEQMNLIIPMITEEGYLYIYVSNETELSEVYFDDLKITHVKSPIIQKDDYYPFGLTFGGYQRQGETENKLKYNGVYYNDLIETYETMFRGYDASLGRFSQVDPLTIMIPDQSPYHFGFNNPVLFQDQLGLMGSNLNQSRVGSGHHWSDKYRSVEGNAMMMSSNTFNSYYGITDSNGNVDQERRNQIANSIGTPAYMVNTNEGNYLYLDRSFVDEFAGGGIENWYKAQNLGSSSQLAVDPVSGSLLFSSVNLMFAENTMNGVRQNFIDLMTYSNENGLGLDFRKEYFKSRGIVKGIKVGGGLLAVGGVVWDGFNTFGANPTMSKPKFFTNVAFTLVGFAGTPGAVISFVYFGVDTLVGWDNVAEQYGNIVEENRKYIPNWDAVPQGGLGF